MQSNIEKYQDPEIEILKTELQNLESIHGELTNEKLELEKLILEFHNRHTLELEEIVLELLHHRKIKFKNDEVRYEETENDERQYREKLKIEKAKDIHQLTDEQKNQLKKTFREATFLCHPDKVSNEFKSIAEKMFIELRTAYELNDINRVTDILNDLKKGGFTPKSKSVSEKGLLIITINQVQSQIEILKSQITEIKQSDSYKTIVEIDNWDEYFFNTKMVLQKELEELKNSTKTDISNDFTAKVEDVQEKKNKTKSNFLSILKNLWS